MTKPIEKWAIAVTTAPRPTATLACTLDSLRLAGWREFRVFADTAGVGAWRNWINALSTLVREEPDADAFAVVQDDVVVCRGLRRYLEQTLWPAVDNVALCSPFTPAAYQERRRGWNVRWPPPNQFLVAAQFWILPPKSARAIVRDLGDVQARKGIDGRVGLWAEQTGRSVWYHAPSLAQHIADANSAIGNPPVASLRVAADFVGEDAFPPEGFSHRVRDRLRDRPVYHHTCIHIPEFPP
ncbi:MAG: hypothetical protein HUU20_27115 [Pirellulales bacterium]|nr:hypothetical protein [Pirellulales bacterium]